MSQTQAHCNRIARSSGEHCHDYPQLMLGWRGAMDYEFSRGSERLALGRAAILPVGKTHRYLGRGDDSEVLVIDLDRNDPCLAALEQSCALALRESLFAAALNAFIDERLDLPPDNQALATAMHLGQSQLHLLCQRQFGVTPQQYVLTRRLQWAHYWLCQTVRPVGEIALDLGFADVSTFSRAFRRRTGRSPSEERHRSTLTGAP